MVPQSEKTLKTIGSVLFLSILVISSTGVHTATSKSADQGGVTTPWPLEFSGMLDVDSQGGAVRVNPSNGIHMSRLEAEELVIEHAWETGYEIRRGISFAKYVTDDGQETVTFANAATGFGSAGGDPLFLAFSEGDALKVSTASATGMTMSAIDGEDVVKVGASPAQFQAGDIDTAGFWYTIDAPVVRGVGGGSVEVEGSFTLFIHNMVLDAEGEDQKWSSWTGYRESDPRRPITEYELRVTTLHVKNGTFTSSSAGDLTLYFPNLDAQAVGTVTSPGVNGRIVDGDEVHVFDQDPLRMQGTGTVSVRAEEAEGAGGGASTAGPHLWLEPSDSFAVSGASSIEILRSEGAGPSSGLAWASSFGLALLGAVGMMVLGVVPAPTRAARRHQHGLWMRRGANAAGRGAWGRASWCYKQAARLRRNEPMTWYEWAHAELEAGRAEMADALACEAATIPGSDRADLLDLRASAAWQRCDWPAFESHLLELARSAPAMARGLVADLGVDLSTLGTRVVDLLEVYPREEGLDGYA